MLWQSTYISLPRNFCPGKPEHVTKKLKGEERGLWGGLHGLLLGPGKVSVETLTPKRARKLRCGTQKWARRWKGAEIIAQNWTIAVGRLAPPPLACMCPPLSPHTTSMRLLHRLCILRGKCGRTVSIERVRFLIQKQRSQKYRTKHFPCGIVFVRYRDVHHWFCKPFISNLFEMLKSKKNGSYTPQNWRDKESEEYS